MITSICVVMLSVTVTAQKRLNPPKSKTNIASVDDFVAAAFTIYNTTFDFYYGPNNNPNEVEEKSIQANEENGEEDLDIDGEEYDAGAGVEDPKDEFKVMEESIDQLLKSVPDILEEIDSHSVSRQLKATLNVNKAVKALKQSGKLMKTSLLGDQ